MGVLKRNPVGAPMITGNFKRAYVMTNHKIDPVLNGVICWMIDKSSNILDDKSFKRQGKGFFQEDLHSRLNVDPSS